MTKQEDESNSHAAADGHIFDNPRMPEVVAPATPETAAMPAAKRNTMVTSTTTKIPTQTVRWEEIPAKGQAEAIKHHTLDDCHFFEDCVDEGLILHKAEVKFSYALIPKKGGTGACGYALTATALSGIPATYKTPSKKQ